MPAATVMLSSGAFATPGVVVTQLGITNGGGTIGAQPAWRSYLLTATADTGDVITSVDFRTGSNGIFGTLLQRWTYSSTISVTPTGTQSANFVDSQSLDTHFVTSPSQTYTVGTIAGEDNNYVNPGLSGSATNTATVYYGTGTFLRGAIGYATGQLQNQNLAYIVAGSTSSVHAVFDVSEAPAGGGTSTSASFNLTFSAPFEPRIAGLSAASSPPTIFGLRLTNGTGVDKATFSPNSPTPDSINVSGSHGVYTPGFANNINNGAGESAFYVQISGFNPANDLETIALNIKINGADPTLAQDAALAAQLEPSVVAIGAGSAPGELLTLCPGYDLFVTTQALSPVDFGVNFNWASIPGVTVTDVAVVPEPASLAGLLLIGGLALGRRIRSG
jgi:hypothetical protein